MSNLFNSIRWIVISSVFKRFLIMAVYYFFLKYVEANDYGVFNEFTTIINLSTLVIFLSTEYLYFLPNKDKQKEKAFLQMGFLGFLVVSVLLVVFSDFIGKIYSNNLLSKTLLFSPLILFIEYVRLSLRVIYQKGMTFKVIAKGEIYNTILYCALFALFLRYNSSVINIVFIYYLGNLIETVYLLFMNKAIVKEFIFCFFMRNLKDMSLIFKKDKRFLFFTTVSHLVGYLGDSSPILLLGVVLNNFATGVYALANQLITAPLQLILGPTERVFFSHLAKQEEDALKSNIEEYGNFCLGFIWLSFSFIIFLLVKLLPYIFPDKWLDALLILVPISIVQGFRIFVIPLGSVILIKRRSDIELIYKVFSMITRASTIIYFSSKGFIFTIEALSIVQIINYLVLVSIIFYLTKIDVLHFIIFNYKSIITVLFFIFLLVYVNNFKIIYVSIGLSILFYFVLLFILNLFSGNKLFRQIKKIIRV